MIWAVLPLGLAHGWGICGRYLAHELSNITDMRLITDDCSFGTVGDEIELHDLLSLLPQGEEGDLLNAAGSQKVNCPLLQGVPDNRTLEPARPRLRGARNVGYAFFEENLVAPQALETVRGSFDVLALGSSWCESVLRSYGVTNLATVLQGVDTSLFRPAPKRLLRDQFVVFSGGKFEFRKGQDVVIRAYKVLQDRHWDVMLVTQWYAPWDYAISTMRASPYIQFKPYSGDQISAMSAVLADNGIDLGRALVLQPRSHALMPSVYANTDVGLFPNRCEGGTNLVLMEYMACSRPVIAAFSSGHRDVLTAGNALLLKTLRQLTVNRDGEPVAVWDDPSLDETIEQLEWAYQHQAELRKLGEQAASDMGQLTWRKTAEEFVRLLTN